MTADHAPDPALTRHAVGTSLGTISVAEVGAGPVLVMLHGGGPGASGVSNYHQNLPALSREFRVLLPDQPGFGESYRPTEADLDAHSITQITVDALLQTLDGARHRALPPAGQQPRRGGRASPGHTRPDRVISLVLMAPGGGWLPFGPDAHRGPEGDVEVLQRRRPVGEEDGLVHLGHGVRPKQFGPEIVTARYEASLDESHIEFYHRYNAAFARRGGMDPLWRDLHKISAPTLLLWGRDDRTITLDGAGIMLKQIRDVQLHVFGRCGHWVQLERQAEFDRMVADFLRSHA